jgi:hypothetical protein
MSLSELVGLEDGPRRGLCVWQRGRLDASNEAVREAVWLVAETAMRERCRGARQIFDLWREAAREDRVLTVAERARVEPFIRTGFGLPGAELSPDHIQGYVGEFVWFILTRERVPEDRILRAIKGPGFHVTGPGGDGLAVYEVAAGLIFRLWEIKKHHGQAHVSSTVSRAYTQLGLNATEYLAQMTALAEQYDDDVAALFATLVELWIDGDSTAGAGVAVATSQSRYPNRCFGTMGNYFPTLTEDGQLEGLLVALGELPDFAVKVKETVWSALLP